MRLLYIVLIMWNIHRLRISRALRHLLVKYSYVQENYYPLHSIHRVEKQFFLLYNPIDVINGVGRYQNRRQYIYYVPRFEFNELITEDKKKLKIKL